MVAVTPPACWHPRGVLPPRSPPLPPTPRSNDLLQQETDGTPAASMVPGVRRVPRGSASSGPMPRLQEKPLPNLRVAHESSPGAPRRLWIRPTDPPVNRLKPPGSEPCPRPQPRSRRLSLPYIRHPRPPGARLHLPSPPPCPPPSPHPPGGPRSAPTSPFPVTGWTRSLWEPGFAGWESPALGLREEREHPQLLTEVVGAPPAAAGQINPLPHPGLILVSPVCSQGSSDAGAVGPPPVPALQRRGPPKCNRIKHPEKPWGDNASLPNAAPENGVRYAERCPVASAAASCPAYQ